MSLLLSLVYICVYVQPHVIGNSYIEYRRGSSNIILSVPHGGSMRPDTIPSRDYGCLQGGRCVWSHDCKIKDKERCKASVLKDLWTLELSEHLADQLTSLTGKRPHLVICNLHRSKLDANRDIAEGAFGIPEAETAWNKYQMYIKEAESNISGSGLLFDIHGQSHPENWIELGYLLSSEKLDHASNQMYRESSINHLSQKSTVPFLELLRGESSLGGFLEKYGYRVVPSPSHPSPSGGRYYSGGYNTRVHGSRDGGVIDAIQIESPRSLRNSNTGPAYAYNLALAIGNFTEMHPKQIAKKNLDETNESSPSSSYGLDSTSSNIFLQSSYKSGSRLNNNTNCSYSNSAGIDKDCSTTYANLANRDSATMTITFIAPSVILHLALSVMS